MDTDERLRRLIDKDEIREVLARYARGVDRLDVALLKSAAYRAPELEAILEATRTGQPRKVSLIPAAPSSFAGHNPG